MNEFELQIIEFMNKVSQDLGSIKASVDMTTEELSEVKKSLNTCAEKIPKIEAGLNNHLSSHNRIKIYFLYPVAVAIIAALLKIFVFK